MTATFIIPTLPLTYRISVDCETYEEYLAVEEFLNEEPLSLEYLEEEINK